MLVRLEEFETMIALVQQERCNSIGLTGSLTQTSDYQKEFKNLCNRIDSLEKVVDHVKDNIDTLESKVDAAEKQLGITDNTSKLKNFLTPIFVSTYLIVVKVLKNKIVNISFAEKK